MGNPKKVLPTKIGSVGPDHRVIEWRDYYPREECPHRLVFDCFEPNVGQCPDAEPGFPIGFESCGDGEPEQCEYPAAHRWYFGWRYCNM